MVAVSRAHLDNGLTLLTVEQPHLHSACVGLFVKCGSRHEGAHEWGLSHFVEHMLFRGSKRFPDARQLARAFERHGGTLHASTWRDHTQLTTPIHPSRLHDALAVLADMVMEPRFGGFDTEKSIVEAELEEELDEKGRDRDINNISRASIWREHPMGRRIAGSRESLRRFSLDDVREHHARHYVANNAVLCVAGRVQDDDVRRLVEQTFGDMPTGTARRDGEAARFSPGMPLGVRRQAGTQLAVQITFEALPDQHKDFAALNLLTRVLDDGASSRLHEALCERRGLVYELCTGLDCYADCGLYDIEMKVPPRRAASAIQSALEVITQLCEEGVGDEEFELVRERTLHELEFSVDSSDELAGQYGAAALFGLPAPLEHKAQELASLTPQDLSRVARDMFLSGRIHTTIIGPVERANMKRIEKLFLGFPPQK